MQAISAAIRRPGGQQFGKHAGTRMCTFTCPSRHMRSSATVGMHHGELVNAACDTTDVFANLPQVAALLLQLSGKVVQHIQCLIQLAVLACCIGCRGAVNASRCPHVLWDPTEIEDVAGVPLRVQLVANRWSSPDMRLWTTLAAYARWKAHDRAIWIHEGTITIQVDELLGRHHTDAQLALYVEILLKPFRAILWNWRGAIATTELDGLNWPGVPLVLDAHTSGHAALHDSWIIIQCNIEFFADRMFLRCLDPKHGLPEKGRSRRPFICRASEPGVAVPDLDQDQGSDLHWVECQDLPSN